jgi:hypothetical protein
MMPGNRRYGTIFTVFPYQKSLRTKEIEELVPARKQGIGKPLVKKFIELPAAQNRKGLADSQDFTKKDFLFQALLLTVKTMLVIGLFGESK